MADLTFLRTDNWVTVSPCPPKVRSILVPLLTFTEHYRKEGMERYAAKKMGAALYADKDVACFIDDHKDRISFPFGFCDMAMSALRRKGHTVRIQNLTPHKNPKVFEPRWDRVFDGETTLRHKQDEFLLKIATYENGLFDCPTGYGKSFMCGMTCVMLPLARIAIVSKSVTVVRDTIYPDVCQMVGEVGIVGGGMKKRGRRVMCYTADSLRWLIKDSEEFGNYDIIIVDEAHLAAADNFSYMMGLVPGQPRLFGLSATLGMRSDGKDYKVRGLFGPVRLRMTYDEARKKGIVVPMEVIVRKLVMDTNPCSGLEDEEKTRAGIWNNAYRNDVIVKDAASYASRKMQTMVSCAVLEHVLRLKKRFEKLKAAGEIDPKVELVCLYRQHANKVEWQKTYREMKAKGVGKTFKSLPYMDNARRQRLVKEIEKGKIKLFAGTTILNVGFDPEDMRVVVRADCTSSKIADHQVPGRNARHAKDKVVGIIRDYWDKFDTGLSNKFKRRESSYKQLKWKVRLLANHSSLNDKMKWGNR